MFVLLFLLSISVFTQTLIVDDTFAPQVNGSVNRLEILPNGKIMIVGDFTTVNGVTRVRIARLNSDGTLDPSFNANAVTVLGDFQYYATINSMQVLPDGKILIAGSFGNGSPIEYYKSVIRLNLNGSSDATMTSFPQIKNEDNLYTYVQKAVQLPNGKILMCGQFTLPNGNQKPNLARYNNNGTYDTTFMLPMNRACTDVAAQPDGKYLIGNYPVIGGGEVLKLTRFNADDGIDTTFNVASGTNGVPLGFGRIEVQSDRKIIGFNNNVRQLNSDGSIYKTFPTADANGGIAFQPNGKAFVTSSSSIAPFGMSRSLNRFNADGTHDPSTGRFEFYGSPSPIYAKTAAATADGKILIGGSFTEISINNVRTTKPYLLRLSLQQAAANRPRYDFDGDGKDDLAVFRPSESVWYLNRSSAGFFSTQFGLPQDKPVAADYDADGKADIAVFRDGVWYWLRSSDSAFTYRICGRAEDIPQPRYDRNGQASFLVFRPSDGKFYVQPPYGNESVADMRGMPTLPGDKPVVADYDGDGIGDLAVFRDGHWFMVISGSLSLRHYQFGQAGDKPAVGDFDGDGRTDYAVFRPSNGVWYIQKSTEGFTAVQWGLADDLLVPADYDGDGKTDVAVYRPSNGAWYQLRSSGSAYVEQYGLANDIPIQLN